MLNKLKKKQHYKRKGEDPRRTQGGGGGQNRVLSPPFIIPVVITTENSLTLFWYLLHVLLHLQAKIPFYTEIVVYIKTFDTMFSINCLCNEGY